MSKVGLSLAGALLGSAALCASAGAATLEPIGGATYSLPTFVTSDPRDPNRLFITEQRGTIRVTTGAGTALFLDLDDRVIDSGYEQGLWSMAFAPDFAESGLFYVAYAANGAGALTLDEYREQPTPAATEATRRPVMSISSPANDNHSAGQLQFGPDGYLYWSTGEDNVPANAQDTSNLLGKILRIDPRQSGANPYTVPASNPFVGGAGADEIWAYGLRNPWRFSFDRMTGALVIADVGSVNWEEVDYATQAAGGGRGLNYGWDECEGFALNCALPGLTAPIYGYNHSPSASNCAIMGGYVVRDPDLGDLVGRYLFADNCGGDLRSINPEAPEAPDNHRAEGLTVDSPSSFGEDACGRLYVAAQGDGRVFRLEGPTGGNCPDGTPAPPDIDPPGTTLKVRRKSRTATNAKVIIGSDEPGSTFECRLDKGRWKSCGERHKLKNLDTGRHRFRARATDAAANTDPSPARKRFRVKPRG